MDNRLAESTERYQVFALLRELDRGVVHHTAWLRDLHRGLICEETEKLADDLLIDAHARCRFGRWYEKKGGLLVRDPTFIEIGKLHQEMHDNARELLHERLVEKSVHPGTYTRFMDTAIQFKLQIRRFQAALVEEVCIVDQLTGTWNRHAMHYKLAQEQERLNRKGGHCCLCMVDIDRFKAVNDRYGHPAGDLVLREVAGLLTRRLRKYDSVFRYGGEEFLLCLPGIEHEKVFQLLDRLRTELAEMRITIPGHQLPLNITASFGMACLSVERGMEEVIAEADTALLWAKKDGRNCIRVWGNDRREQES